jgi:serine/threonine protein kinase/tetratricopeptide (TPR) repeat protein
MESSALGFKTILYEARGLSGPARTDFLRRVCGENHALFEELESLLAFEGAVPSLLDDAQMLEKLKEKAGAFATIDFDHVDASSARDALGDRIGAYRLVEVIGEGGMGVVYRAEQTVPIRREVALKLIRRGLDTDRIIARFQSERQALARMDHPSIARVLDAGTSGDGRPYFVMELVHGVPITDFCDRERLTLRERAELMIAVCQAVQHAHQKGIIHRDLKPSNILVARQDGVPVPKVIDFGIAKAIEPDGDHTLLTREGQFIGTPDYMSPEQAGVIDVDADTRADVYALGVLLYELLSGRRPHLFERRTQEAVQQVLRDSRPDKPSTAVSNRRRRITRNTASLDAYALQVIVDSRRTTADRLRRQLAGDLDTIVLKAMQKEPVRRYGSAEAFADDLRRYLEGLPVLARPDTWTYRTDKFVRRHALGVGVAAAAAVMLVAFAVLMAVQSRRIARERDRALVAEQHARIEAQTAQQVSEFLVGLFEVSDPGKARGNTITAREILDRGAQRISANLQDSPDVQTRLMQTMGNVYKQLGLYDEAERLLRQALEERERSGASHGDIGNNLDTLGDVQRYRGKMALAEPLLRRALDLRREAFGPESTQVGQTLNNLALVLEAQDKFEPAEKLERESLRIRRKASGARSTDAANSLLNLGIILKSRDRFDEAEAAQRESLDIRRERLGALHPSVAASLRSLANTLSSKNRNEEAEPLLREALAIYRKVMEPGSNFLDAAMNDLASVLQDRGKLDEAEAFYVEALGIARTRDNGQNMETALDLNNLASLYEERGEYAKADPLLRETLELRRTLRGDHSLPVATALNNLGRLRFNQHDLPAAERLLREAFAIRSEFGGASSTLAAATRVNLARVLQAKGALEEAEREVRAASIVVEKALPADHPGRLTTQLVLARVLLDRHHPADAEPLLRHVVEARTRTLAPGHWLIADAKVALARALVALGRPGEAEPLLRDSVDVLKTASKAHDPLKREADAALAQLARTRRPPPPAAAAATASP